MRTSRCKSCGASVIWAITERGKNMPLDNVQTTEGVRYAITEGGSGKLYCRRVTEDGAKGHPTHWGSCPRAGDFKKR